MKETPKQRLGVRFTAAGAAAYGGGHDRRASGTGGGGLTGIEEEAEAIDDCTKWSK